MNGPEAGSQFRQQLIISIILLVLIGAVALLVSMSPLNLSGEGNGNAQSSRSSTSQQVLQDPDLIDSQVDNNSTKKVTAKLVPQTSTKFAVVAMLPEDMTAAEVESVAYELQLTDTVGSPVFTSNDSFKIELDNSSDGQILKVAYGVAPGSKVNIQSDEITLGEVELGVNTNTSALEVKGKLIINGNSYNLSVINATNE